MVVYCKAAGAADKVISEKMESTKSVNLAGAEVANDGDTCQKP